jgi:hypothetical protein
MIGNSKMPECKINVDVTNNEAPLRGRVETAEQIPEADLRRQECQQSIESRPRDRARAREEVLVGSCSELSD